MKHVRGRCSSLCDGSFAAWRALTLSFVIAMATTPAAFGQGSDTERPAASRSAEPEPATPAASRDPRIDGETGRDRRVWLTHPIFRHHRFTLELLIPDMGKHEFTATATLVLSPIGGKQTKVTLDAGTALSFSSARVNGVSTTFEHNAQDQKLTVNLPTPAARDEQFTLVLDYTAIKPVGRGEALTWSGDDRRTPEVDFMMHTQGQPQSNHRWFPCHDFPNLRVPTEIIVTVPEPYEAVSNGQLLSVTRRSYASMGLTPPSPVTSMTSTKEDPAEPEPSPTHLRRFHWKQAKPHPYYLTCLVVGRFDVENLGGPTSTMPGLSMPVYGPIGSGEQIKRVFANTPDMIAHFGKLFDEPFPWDKYAQVLCRDFTAGAMENTSIVTFNSALVRGGGRRGSIDDIIAHELVHHWFGNLITCKSWEHLWLNEGWASYGEALWAEKTRGDDGYHEAIAQFVRRERASSSGRTAPRRVGMVSNLYRNPDSRFTSGDNVYSKGAVVLHMLRMRLGDDLFFEGVRKYIDRHTFGLVETSDFRVVMEEVSGQSLERFFQQWCMRPGHPSLAIDLDFAEADSAPSSAGGTLSVTLEQTQTIDPDNPAYAFVLPIWVRFDDDNGQYVYVSTEERKAVQTFVLPRRPVDVDIDPNMTVLSRNTLRKGLDRPPTPAATPE